MQRIRWGLLLLGIVIVLVFSLYNSHNVQVKLPLMEDHELPLSMLLLAAAATSFVFGSIMTAWMSRGRRKAAIAKERARIDEALAETKENLEAETGSFLSS